MDILKGDIFYVTRGGRTFGSEQYPDRPAVIVSNNLGNKHSNVVEIVYLTTQEKNPLPTHVKVMCHVPSIALCEQIWTVSKDRLGGYIRSCSDAEMDDINRALLISLDLDEMMLDIPKEIEELNEKLAEKDRMMEELKGEKEMIDSSSVLEGNIIKLEAERDIYKGLYEQLLQKMTS